MAAKETIYIIGAGISGLIAAYELEQAGYTPVVLEKSDTVGGRVRTVKKNGYHLDLGFQVLLDAYPLANTYLDMDALHLQRLESGSQIYVEGKRYLIGDALRNIRLLVPTLLADIGSLTDKVKVLALSRRLKKKSLNAIFGSPETSTLDYLQSQGFSNKIIDRFFRPFFSGIFLESELRTSSRMFEFVYKMFGEGYATIPEQGIGAISEQLKGKLKTTQFQFGQEVKRVTNEHITLANGEQLNHSGVIITANASQLVSNMKDQTVEWKSCTCLYFEVDTTSIPKGTIALVADKGKLANNLYAYKDASGKQLLSVTTLKHAGKTNEELTQAIEAEVKEYCGIQRIKHIGNFEIPKALPDLTHLKMTTEPSESQLTEHIFLAGDVLFNGSLNAAMESGRLAALGLLEKKSGIMM
ncbi:NAD(P)/FAD-dependent oxidoreductase [Schleiferiaceae bacterium]|nr:oxidoreductase [Flavobacteriales bacterium]MDC1022029.1 NAD(P)/FAD-dependent oxidoreductase [Schleiferiaceae bacterium]|tara:strand:+ start:1002 stop:2237 length:1236 start_codon:yes stop_codon:yes gene_type:complete